MTFNNKEENVESIGLGYLLLVGIVILLAVITLSPVWAWEEQLEACRIRRIQPSMCPDDESYVGIPYNPTPIVTNTSSHTYSSGRTTFTKWVWVYSETTYYNPEEKICYNSYKRRIQYFKNNKTIVENFPKVTKNECTLPRWHTINLVFNK